MTVVQDLGRRVTTSEVISVTARYFNMSPAQLLERTRRHSICHARQVAMYVATRVTSNSLPALGAQFAGRAVMASGEKVVHGFDHTTIMYARDAVARRMSTDPETVQAVTDIIRLLRRGPTA